MAPEGYERLPTTSPDLAPKANSAWLAKFRTIPRLLAHPTRLQSQPRLLVITVSTLGLLFTFLALSSWDYLGLFAFSGSPWASDANNFKGIFLSEARLPQHDLSAKYPEGKEGRYLRFSNQVWGLGWNNLLQERLLNTLLAYESDRAPVFSPFEAWAHPPRNDTLPDGNRQVLVIPYNALLSGPTAGAPWGPGDHHPRAISQDWWEKVCPQSRRKVVNADDVMKQVGRNSDGLRMLREWTTLLKNMPEQCVELVGTQVFDFLLIGDSRVLSLWNTFSKHPVVQLLEDSEVAKVAVSRNIEKLRNRSRFTVASSASRPSQTLHGLVAVQIRRGDFRGDIGQDNGHCLHFSKWGSSFSGWSQLPQLHYKFNPPSRGTVPWGENSPELAEYYLQRCLPTPAQVTARLHAIRAESMEPLSRIFIATNAEESYLSDLRTLLAEDGWTPDSIITSGDLDLNWQAESVSVVVDMSILTRAQVFVGNGFSSLASNVVMRRLTTGMPIESVMFWIAEERGIAATATATAAATQLIYTPLIGTLLSLIDSLTTTMLFKSLLAPFVFAISAFGAPVELEARQSCSALQLVHVSGTTEIGLGIVGTPLAAALARSGVTAKSITYDTVAEYIVTVAAGAAITEAYLRLQSAACPNQRFVLSGYSKGALVLHKLDLSSALKSKIASILVFGDPARNINSPWPINNPSVDLAPKDGSSSSQNIASFCNTGDLFCAIPGVSLPAHLAYPTDGSITVAANFAKARP